LEFPVGIAPEEAKGFEFSSGDKLKISDGDTGQYFQEAFRIADNIRQPRKEVWDTAWNLYNGVYSWDGKAEWQSKNNIPKIRGVVDKATSTFRRALVRMKKFYSIESETQLGIEQGLFTTSLMDYWFDQIGFIVPFTEGLKNGLLTGVIAFKIWWDWVEDYEPRWETKMVSEPIIEMGIEVGTQMVPQQTLLREPRVRGRLGLKAINSYDLWIGPRNSYKIERAKVDLAYLYKMADAGFYSKEAVDQLAAIGQGNDDGQRAQDARHRGENDQTPTNKYIREVTIYHYWGPIYSQEGRLIHPNATFTIAGDSTTVLRKPQKNPFFHGQDPYVVGTPFTVPFSNYNRGIVEDISGIANMITELSNLIIDGAQFDAIPAYEIDSDLCDNPLQVKKGVFPGMGVFTKGLDNPSNRNVIRPVAGGRVPQLALQVLQFLDKEQQLSTSVINALRGQAIGTDTLGEFNSIVGGASESLDDAARTVEESTIDFMLDKSAKVIFQYHSDFTLPRLTENFSKTAFGLSEMSSEERYATMIGGFSFKARGVSIFLDKAQDLNKVMQFVQLISNVPGILTRLNIDEMLEQIIVALGWNPNKILVNPATQPVVPPAVLAGNPQPAGSSGFPNPQQAAQLTPAQISAGQQGAMMGGATNNPMANPNTGAPQQ
jgi:hypothetical protein